MKTQLIVTLLSGAALIVPAAAVADAGHGKRDAKPAGGSVAKGHGKGTAKTTKKVTFVFRGSLTGDGAVQVRAGNAHVSKGGFLGQALTFDFASARVVVADTNADGKVDLDDVKAGDVVLVKARLSKGTKFAAAAEGGSAEPLVASRLIDKTNAPLEDAKPTEPEDSTSN